MNLSMKRFKADLWTILREPVMFLFMLVPLLVMIVFKILLPIAQKWLLIKVGFDLLPYNIYFLTIIFIFAPSILGTVSGFMMLDEKDCHITELMLVTPSGLSGYIGGRIVSFIILSSIYVIAGYYIQNIMSLSPYVLAVIILLAAIESSIISLLIFSLANDKVQGLTYAKGLGILMIPVFVDLLEIRILDIIAYISPFYWVYKMIMSPSIILFFISLVVHIIWLIVPLRMCIRKIYS